jgi:hypothetical protein
MEHIIVVLTSPHVPKGKVIWIIPTSSFPPPSSPPTLPPPSSPRTPPPPLSLSTPTYFLRPFQPIGGINYDPSHHP